MKLLQKSIDKTIFVWYNMVQTVIFHKEKEQMEQKHSVNYELVASGEFTLDAISVNHSYVTPPNTYLRYANEHHHDRIVCVVAGECSFDMFHDSPIIATAGDVVYIPYNIAYQTQWLGDTRGEVYSVNYIMKDRLSQQITICPEIHRFDACGSNLVRGIFKECFYTFTKENYAHALKCKYTFLKLLHTIICAENEQAHSKVGRAIRFIEANYLDEIPIAELARMCNLGECMFRRCFKAETGISPLKYRNRYRIMKAYDMLVSESCSVARAMELTGFYDASYFNKTFKAFTGKSPSEIKKHKE